MKVLMFRANPCTNDPRVYAEATSLLRAGYEVTVIAWDREKKNPPRQDWDGINVVRVRTPLSPKYGVCLVVVEWLQFAFVVAASLSPGSNIK